MGASYKGALVLKISNVDLVQVHLAVNAGIWTVLAEMLHYVAATHVVACKQVTSKLGKDAELHGWYVDLPLGGQRLEIGLYRCCSQRWLMYRFKGAISVGAFEEALAPLAEASLAHALVKGTVKVLELCVDFVGLKSGDYLLHRKGVRSSSVIVNEAQTGITQYAGNPHSLVQAVLYDKAQEMIDKGGNSPFKDSLRFELRLRNRKASLLELMHAIGSTDPFAGTFIVERHAALAQKTKIASWGLFVSTCWMYGVAVALRMFKPHKETFLKLLKELNVDKLVPCGKDFVPILEGLLPPALVSKALNDPPLPFSV
jgi:hypothetical protein